MPTVPRGAEKHSTEPKAKKFGGVRVTVAAPTIRDDKCVCGRTNAECIEYWETKLGITGFSGDGSGGVRSEYMRNLDKQRAAITQGLDPYCFRARLKAYGYVPHWTPHMPTGSFPLTPKHVEEHHPKHVEKQDGKGEGNRNQRGRGGGSATGGSGRRGKRKSVRRKR